MQVKRFTFNLIEENTYVLWDDSCEAAIIDCGAFFPEECRLLQQFVEAHGLKVVCALQTHAHFDHVFGCQFLYERYGVRPQMHAAEGQNYNSVEEQIRRFIHRAIPVKVPPAGPYFSDGERIRFGHSELRVIATPGHTAGGVCFYYEAAQLLLSGDSLFRGAIGRTDLPGGDYGALVSSLRENVLQLPDETRVLPGHGEDTTVGQERLHNPYLVTVKK